MTGKSPGNSWSESSGAALQVIALWRAPLPGDGLQLEGVSITLLSAHLSAAFFPLLPNPPGQVILPIIPCSRSHGHTITSALIARLQSSWSPSFSARGGGGGAVFLAAGKVPFPAWLPCALGLFRYCWPPAGPPALQLPTMLVSHTGAPRVVGGEGEIQPHKQLPLSDHLLCSAHLTYISI